MEYLEENHLENILLHTEVNVRGCKIYGKPTKPQQDWIEVKVDDDLFQVQCLIFVRLEEPLDEEIVTPLHTVCEPGTYAIVHFLGYDIFGDFPNNLQLYGVPQRNFYQHEDCFLIRGWSKHTTQIHQKLRNGDKPVPMLAMVNMKCFQRPLIAVEDHGSGYPHSWLLTAERKCWADAFVVRMSHDV